MSSKLFCVSTTELTVEFHDPVMEWLRFNDDYYHRKQAKERRFVFEGKYSGVIQWYKAYCGFGYLVPDDPLDTMPPGVRVAIESNQWHGLYFRGIDLAVSWSRRDGG